MGFHYSGVAAHFAYEEVVWCHTYTFSYKQIEQRGGVGLHVIFIYIFVWAKIERQSANFLQCLYKKVYGWHQTTKWAATPDEV